MTRPLAITSPNHAIALALYFILGLLGLAFTLNLAQPIAVNKAWGEGVGDLWSVVLFIGGSVAFWAALTAPRRRTPDTSLILELWASVALAVVLGMYSVCMLTVYETMAAVPSLTFALSLTFGFIGRAVQIKSERRRLSTARDHPVLSDPVLGDPRDKD